MPQEEARDEAIRRAKERIRPSLASGREDIQRRCTRLGLPLPEGDSIDFPLFDSPARLNLSTLALTDDAGGERSQADKILFLHYFAYEGILSAGGEPISFRDFPGGAFYWEPFRSRTGKVVERKYGDDLRGLRSALGRFRWTELECGSRGDLSARVQGFGHLALILIAYAAEEGLGAEVELLFEPAMRRVFGAEDAAAFASRICLGLL